MTTVTFKHKASAYTFTLSSDTLPHVLDAVSSVVKLETLEVIQINREAK